MLVKIRVAIVAGLTSLIPQLLQASGDMSVVGIAPSLAVLRRNLAKWDPDIIILEMALVQSLPALIAYIARTHRQTRCVVARHRESATLLARYLKEGAVGYTMRTDFTDCAAIVRQAKYRVAWLSADVAQVINADLRQAAIRRHVSRILSPNEQLILDNIVLGKTCVMIAALDMAWDEQVVLAQIYNLLIHYQQA